MPWGAVAAAGIAAVSASSSRSQEKKLRQQELQQRQQELDFAKKRYEENQALYGETRRQLVDMANEGVKADLQGVTDRASADVAQSFQKDEEAAARGLSRYGINPNSARAMAVRAGMGTAKATAEAGLVNTARRNEKRYADETTWNRRDAVSRIGAAELSGSAAGVSGAYDGLADVYGQGAARAGADAAEGYDMAGQAIGMGLSAYLKRPQTPPPSTVTPRTMATNDDLSPYQMQA